MEIVPIIDWLKREREERFEGEQITLEVPSLPELPRDKEPEQQRGVMTFEI